MNGWKEGRKDGRVDGNGLMKFFIDTRRPPPFSSSAGITVLVGP